MKLSSILRKSDFATVTLATLATLEGKKEEKQPTVATVATVTVANCEKTENEQAANDSELNDVIPMFPIGGGFNPVKDLGGGWIVSACFQCQHCKQRTAGGLCAGKRPDLPLETALLRVLPADKGAGCKAFKEATEGGINAENTENAKEWNRRQTIHKML